MSNKSPDIGSHFTPRRPFLTGNRGHYDRPRRGGKKKGLGEEEEARAFASGLLRGADVPPRFDSLDLTLENVGGAGVRSLVHRGRFESMEPAAGFAAVP